MLSSPHPKANIYLSASMASTEFYFNFRNPKPRPLLKFEGDTHYTNHSLRFTKTDDHDNPLQWSKGRGIYSKPVVFRLGDQKANFETEVQFKVTQMENIRYGDGLAFFIVPEGYKYPTDPGGNFGIFGRPGVFAVVFDIYPQNTIKLGICFSERTPKISVPLPADSFLGIGLKLNVSYNSAIKCISASISNGNNMTSSLNFTYDLSHFLPPKVEVGLGSSTGEYVAVHDAFSWRFKSVVPQATS